MAFNTFVMIDGMPGESTDDKHKDWMYQRSTGEFHSPPRPQQALLAVILPKERIFGIVDYKNHR